MPNATNKPELAAQLRQKILEHLDAAEAQLGEAYQQLRQFKDIRRRHWSYPKEAILDPLRPLLRLFKQDHKLPNRRDQQLSLALTEEWLALPQLFQQLNKLCLEYSDSDPLHHLNQTQQTQLIEALNKQMTRLGLSRDGLRDGGMIAAIALGQLVAKQSSVSGSAFALGAGVGGNLYLAQHTGFNWLWLHVTGVPAWVSIASGLAGLLLTLMMLPLISPLAEWLIWRWRGKRIMKDYLHQVREALLKPKYNGVDAASILAQYAQWLPDALALIRMR